MMMVMFVRVSRTVLGLEDISRIKNHALGLKKVWSLPWSGTPLV